MPAAIASMDTATVTPPHAEDPGALRPSALLWPAPGPRSIHLPIARQERLTRQVAENDLQMLLLQLFQGAARLLLARNALRKSVTLLLPFCTAHAA